VYRRGAPAYSTGIRGVSAPSFSVDIHVEAVQYQGLAWEAGKPALSGAYPILGKRLFSHILYADQLLFAVCGSVNKSASEIGGAFKCLIPQVGIPLRHLG
jgi:hypothetical protein